MEKGTIIEITAPNGAVINTVIIDVIKDRNGSENNYQSFNTYVCYGNNTLFICKNEEYYDNGIDFNGEPYVDSNETTVIFDHIIMEDVNIPYIDNLIK